MWLLKVCKRKTKRFIKAMRSCFLTLWCMVRADVPSVQSAQKRLTMHEIKKAEKNFFFDLNLIRHITLQEGKLLRLHGNRQTRCPRAPWQENGWERDSVVFITARFLISLWIPFERERERVQSILLTCYRLLHSVNSPDRGQLFVSCLRMDT